MVKRERQQPFDYAAQWDAPDTEELTLPSGKKVLVQSPNLPAMAAAGKIPNHLIPIVERFVLGGMPELMNAVPGITDPNAAPGERLLRTADLNAYLDVFCVAACVAPQFTLDEFPGRIHVSKVDAGDKFAIWDWGVGLTAGLAAFRGDQGGALATVGDGSDGEAVRDTTERAVGPDAARAGVAGLSGGHDGGALGPLGGSGIGADGPQGATADLAGSAAQ